MPKSPTVLEVENLLFRRGRDILKGINWRVARGEHWCILGPNGCGKTTLINVLTGYDSATGGRMSVDGQVYGESDWREVRKRVGIVASTLTTMLESGEPVIDVVGSGREAMLNLVEQVSDDVYAEASALLEDFGCGHLEGAYWGTLSQGEKQKVLICRALMAKYHLLILDEPCAGLDPVAREVFLRWLATLAAKKSAPSMIMVTHHVEEILPCISHVLVLQGGRVVAAGKKEEVLTSAYLTEAYGAPVELTCEGERYRLSVASP